MHVAVDCMKSMPTIECLIRAGSDVLASVRSTGDTLLHLLFKERWVVEPDDALYLAGKVQLSGAGEDGGSSAVPHDTDLLRYLIGRGADVNARNKEGSTPIFNFFRHGRIRVKLEHTKPIRRQNAQTMTEDYREREGLEISAAVDKEPLIWRLLDDVGVDWTAVNSKGQTLLHVVAAEHPSRDESASRRKVNRFRFLMDKGLDPMKEDEEHRTSLDVAAALGSEDILALFKS